MRKSFKITGFAIAGTIIILFLLAAVPIASADISKPELSSPENNSRTNDNTPEFRWKSLENAENYRLVIDDNKSFADGENYYDNSNIQVNLLKLPSDNSLKDGTWYWKVRGENGNSVGDWSDTWQFEVDTVPPDPPNLVSPENNGIIYQSYLTLKWDVEDYPQSVEYKCVLDRNPNFSSVDKDSGWRSDNSFRVEGLESGEWYWKVKVKDNVGNIENSGVYSFTVAVPTLVGPKDGYITNENTVSLTWDNRVSTDSFEILIDNDSDFNSPEDEIVSQSNEDVSTLPDENYFWRVRYLSPKKSEFSSVGNFLVDTKAPSRPSSSENNGMVTNDNTPLLTWESVEDISGSDTGDKAGIADYELWLDSDDNFSTNTIKVEGIPSNSIEVDFEELRENIYYYKVKAWDRAGNSSDFSQVWTFTVDVTPPNIVSREVIVHENSATVKWNTDEASDSFVEYGTDENFGENKWDEDMVKEHSINIKNLSENTTYYFRIKSTDNANNSVVSQENTFRTLVLMDPESKIDNIAKYWYNTENVKITASAHDNDGDVTNVQLYYRYRERENLDWEPWSFYVADNDPPWDWNFDAPSGDGHYEFYTLAIDNDDQTETPPDTADGRMGLDTTAPDFSEFQINGENTVTNLPVVRITINASDKHSGLDEMRLKYEQQSWQEWENFRNERDFKLSFPNGDKRISLQIKDSAGNESRILENEILLENATFSENLGSIMKGEEKITNFVEWDLPVESVGVTPVEEIENAYVSLRVQKERPLEVLAGESLNIINYFELKTSISEEKIAEIMIKFRVKKSWLRDKGFERGDVRFWKFKKDKRVLLPVHIDSVDGNYVKYSASVSNLSWFAISAHGVGGEVVFWLVLSLIMSLIIAVIIILKRGRFWEFRASDRGMPS